MAVFSLSVCLCLCLCLCLSVCLSVCLCLSLRLCLSASVCLSLCLSLSVSLSLCWTFTNCVCNLPSCGLLFLSDAGVNATEGELILETHNDVSNAAENALKTSVAWLVELHEISYLEPVSPMTNPWPLNYTVTATSNATEV